MTSILPSRILQLEKNSKRLFRTSHFRQSKNTKLKATLKDAVKERIITADPFISINNVRAEGSNRVYLTQAEVKKLYLTPCPMLPSIRIASLFSCLTGIRWSDIEKLTWGEIEETDQSDISLLKYRQKKTGRSEYLPISNQARELLGARKPQTEFTFT